MLVEKITKKEDLVETFAQVLVKLVGKNSIIELKIKDFTIDAIGLKTTLTGSISLNLAYSSRKSLGVAHLPFSFDGLMKMLTNMELLTDLMDTFSSGGINILQNEREILHLHTENKKIEINLQDTQPIWNLLNLKNLSSLLKLLKLLNLLKLKKLLKALKYGIKVAERLKKEELTVTVSYKDGTVLKVGAEANPRLVRFSNAIEIGSIGELVKIMGDMAKNRF